MVVLYITAFVVISFVLAFVFVLSFNSELTPFDRGESFNNKWPKITDVEFVQRCSSKIDLEVAKKVRDILSNALGVDRERIHPQQNLITDLEAE